ncbi:hypothetical protein EHN06_07265 [Marinobacter sp. NP-4(2019)]|uniref:hypothetical protein n=1 Tax=Marinobacter sp. NP-4(2019) TaxID=2488665 RepID=UPI000FC3CF16|nr:hypothetical protein [Marinobacter sp. NP-4(2019)]AZT83362.1 hypothetical protein EHN06_07265 [Marinobacter sp. NP-4(2019)]
MLKELWRKLGSEFSRSGYAGGQGCEIDDAGGNRVRLLPNITHTGELHLERLTNLLKSRYGKSFNDADESGDKNIRALIHFASRIQDQDIQRELLLFYLNCSPVIQEYLRSEEVLGHQHFLNKA